MKTEKQILLIKVAYFIILISSIVFWLDDFKKGFTSGWEGNDQVNSPNFLEGVFAMFAAYLGLKVLINLYLFINSIQKNEIFKEKNITRLSMIGKHSILLSIAFYVFYFLKISSQMPNIALLQKIKIVDLDFWLLLFGLTLLTISFVFKKDIELQQEKDLTI